MAKIEVGGIKFTGGKMTAIIIALSSTIGVLYGAFEVYKDYMDMKEQIQSYEAPDLSEFDKRIALIEERVISLEDLERTFREVDDRTADTQRDLRNDVYEMEQDMQSRLNAIEIDIQKRLRETDQDLRETREDLQEQIEKILSNPLNVTE